VNPAVKNENGSPARDPLSKEQTIKQVNVTTSSQKVSNSAYSFCKSFAKTTLQKRDLW